MKITDGLIKPKDPEIYITCNDHRARPRKNVKVCEVCVDRDLCGDYAKYQEGE